MKTEKAVPKVAPEPNPTDADIPFDPFAAEAEFMAACVEEITKTFGFIAEMVQEQSRLEQKWFEGTNLAEPPESGNGAGNDHGQDLRAPD